MAKGEKRSIEELATEARAKLKKLTQRLAAERQARNAEFGSEMAKLFKAGPLDLKKVQALCEQYVSVGEDAKASSKTTEK